MRSPASFVCELGREELAVAVNIRELESKWVTPTQAADRAGVSRQAIWGAAQERRIRSAHVGGDYPGRGITIIEVMSLDGWIRERQSA